MPKKPNPETLCKPKQAGQVGKLLAKFPTVASYLLDLYYEDDPDASRQPSGMYLKFDGGDLHCWFSDPALERQVKLVVPSWDELLPALELLLASDRCPWTERKENGAGRGQSARRK